MVVVRSSAVDVAPSTSTPRAAVPNRSTLRFRGACGVVRPPGSDPAVTIDYGVEVTAVHGTDKLDAVTVRYGRDGAQRSLPACALFVMVGAAPNTDWLSGLVELDDKGFVRTGEEVGGSSPYATSRPGIFAVGDVRAGSVKRVASSVGEGSVVISRVWEFLNR